MVLHRRILNEFLARMKLNWNHIGSTVLRGQKYFESKKRKYTGLWDRSMFQQPAKFLKQKHVDGFLADYLWPMNLTSQLVIYTNTTSRDIFSRLLEIRMVCGGNCSCIPRNVFSETTFRNVMWYEDVDHTKIPLEMVISMGNPQWKVQVILGAALILRQTPRWNHDFPG